MDAVDCIQTRMSIRGFKKDPVPQDLLAKVIETARATLDASPPDERSSASIPR